MSSAGSMSEKSLETPKRPGELAAVTLMARHRLDHFEPNERAARVTRNATRTRAAKLIQGPHEQLEVLRCWRWLFGHSHYPAVLGGWFLPSFASLFASSHEASRRRLTPISRERIGPHPMVHSISSGR